MQSRTGFTFCSKTTKKVDLGTVNDLIDTPGSSVADAGEEPGPLIFRPN